MSVGGGVKAGSSRCQGPDSGTCQGWPRATGKPAGVSEVGARKGLAPIQERLLCGHYLGVRARWGVGVGRGQAQDVPGGYCSNLVVLDHSGGLEKVRSGRFCIS